jgi:hypothetical protein
MKLDFAENALATTAAANGRLEMGPKRSEVWRNILHEECSLRIPFQKGRQLTLVRARLPAKFGNPQK